MSPGHLSFHGQRAPGQTASGQVNPGQKAPRQAPVHRSLLHNLYPSPVALIHLNGQKTRGSCSQIWLIIIPV